jgi:hypothetical protein
MTALGLALRWRAGRALALAVGAVTSAFLADVYVAQIAPHFGQRAVVDAYYEDRKAHEPLVAYQLNWKGENFYTGNHLALYVSSGPPMQAWVDKLFTRGERTVYFLTEHGRVASLRAELPAWRVTPVTDVRTSQAFVLVRAER